MLLCALNATQHIYNVCWIMFIKKLINVSYMNDRLGGVTVT